ncbi:MAG: hypothetical protein PF505_03680 [Vallitaleaceae bacterium]|nr:hypothetical protein [Vallitaleaceae bacterium]
MERFDNHLVRFEAEGLKPLPNAALMISPEVCLFITLQRPNIFNNAIIAFLNGL